MTMIWAIPILVLLVLIAWVLTGGHDHEDWR